MTTTDPKAPKAPKPVLTGFCGPGMDDDSHRRCPSSVSGHPCPCQCCHHGAPTFHSHKAALMHAAGRATPERRQSVKSTPRGWAVIER